MYSITIYLSGSALVESSVSREVKKAGRVNSFYSTPEAGEFRHWIEEPGSLNKSMLIVPYAYIAGQFQDEPEKLQTVQNIIHSKNRLPRSGRS